MKLTNKKAQKILSRLREDFEFFARNFLWIKTKPGDLVRFKINPAQQELLRIIYEMIALGQPVRIVILKARQMGVSTFIQAFLYWLNSTRPNRHHMTIAHDSDAVDHLFDMTKLFHDASPNWLRPMKRYSNKKELRFENPDDKTRYANPGLRSKTIVQTAEKREGTARGQTYHGVHCSESTRWGSGEKAKLALRNSVPKTQWSFLFDESTARGIGGDFHDTYWKAKKLYPQGLYGYRAVFLPWTIDPEYSLPLTKKEQKTKDLIPELTEEEISLRDEHSLTLGQLKWRRDTTENECGGDPLLFAQEYPLTDLEAFIAESASIFHRLALQAQYRRAQENEHKKKVGYLCVAEGNKLRFVEDRTGFLNLYEFPSRHDTYCIAADTAEGRDKDSDFCTLGVFNTRTGNQAAQWHPIDQKHQPDLDELAKSAYLIGHYYNQAVIAPESNFDSTIIYCLRQLEYPMIYKHEDHASGRRKRTDKYGFRATKRSRKDAIDYLKQDIREDTIILNDLPTIQELTTFIRKGDKLEASEGCNDDRVTTTYICAYVRFSVPAKRPKAPRPNKERIGDIINSIKNRGAA